MPTSNLVPLDDLPDELRPPTAAAGSRLVPDDDLPDALKPAPKKPGFWSEAGDVAKGFFTGTAQLAKKVATGDIAGASRDLLQPNLDALERAAESYGEGKYADMLRHGIAGAVPMIGPMSERAGDLAQEGNYAGAAGATVANAALLAAPEMARGAVGAVGRGAEAAGRYGVRQSLGRINKRTAATTADINRGVDAILKEGATVDEAGLQAMQDAVSKTEAAKSSIVDADPTRSISPAAGARAGRTMTERLSDQAAPSSEIAAVNRVVQDFYEADRPGGVISRPGKAARNLTAREAQDLKAGTYQRVGERAYMPETKHSASVMTEKQIAHELNKSLTEAFPELEPLNRKQGGQIIGRRMIRDAVDRGKRSGHRSGVLGAVAGGAVGYAEGGALGSALGAITGGSVAELTAAVLRDPGVRSNLAIKLYRAGKGIKSLSEAKSIVQQRAEALAEQTRKDPNVDAPRLERPSLGLSIRHLNTGETLPTTRNDIAQMVNAIVDSKLGGDIVRAKPHEIAAIAEKYYGPKWNTETLGGKEKTVSPEQALALGRRGRAHLAKYLAERTQEGRFVDQATINKYHTDPSGVRSQPWYRRGVQKVIRRWKGDLGDAGARKAFDDVIRYENLYSANRGVDEAMDMGIRAQLATHGWMDFPVPMDVNTKAGQGAMDSAGLHKTLGGGIVGGPKLEPFGASKRAGVEPNNLDLQPKKTVADRIEHGIYLGDTTTRPTRSTRGYIDFRNRIEAHDMMERGEMLPDGPPEIQQAQARGWGAYETLVQNEPTKGDVSFAERTAARVDFYGGPKAVFMGDRAAFEASPYYRELMRSRGEDIGDISFNHGANIKTKSSRSPNPEVAAVANAYNAEHGFSPTEVVRPKPIDVKRAKAIAAEYDALPKNDPRAKPSYDQFAKEIERQYDAITEAGYTLEPWTGEGQPYQTSVEMMNDVAQNKHLYFFTGGEPHPFLSTKVRDTGLTHNDMFRAVHDFFGHAKNGLQFGPMGEEAAWASHVQMFSPLAAKAMTAETRGQNSWVNFGPHSDLPVKERPYAAQKAALLSDSFGPSFVTRKKAAELARTLESRDGFTLPADGVQKETGYTYSPYKKRERKAKRAFSGKEIEDYANANADLLAQPNHNLGGWKEKGGLRFLDVSVYEPDLATALREAKAANQKAIWDNKHGENIPLKGTASVVTLNDGRTLISPFVPTANPKGLMTHVQLLQKHGITLEHVKEGLDIANTGWIVDGELQQGGGGTVGQGVVRGIGERPKDYVPYKNRAEE